MSFTFNEIVIIYNPNSTGNSEHNAKVFKKRLEAKRVKAKLTIISTDHAGHAEEIAERYASGKTNVLIVSSSGDGGYNEVVNGVLKVAHHDNVATAVLPSGNANDHARSVGSGNLLENIVNGKVETIETIKVTSVVEEKPWVRYAHSYVGFGLTPKIGRELTSLKLNVVNEKWHTLYHLLKFKHVDLTAGGKVRRFSSLIFATVRQMSKVIKLDQGAHKNDGKMEVYETDYKSPIQLINMLFHASLKGMSHTDRRERYDIRTIKPTLIQLDGEVFVLDAESDVTIECEKNVLRTVL